MRKLLTGLFLVVLAQAAWAATPSTVPSPQVKALVLNLADPLRKEASSRELLRLGDAVLPQLGKLIQTDLSALNRAELVSLLGRFGPKAVPIIVQASKDRLLEADAARAIASMNDPAATVQPMAGFLASANPKVRLFALRWFETNHRPLPNEEQRLVQLLGDPSNDVRDLAGAMVADRCPARCLSGALTIYRNESVKASSANLVLRLGLLKTMGFIGAREPRLGAMLPPVLIQAIYIKDQQQASIDALVAIGQPAVPALLMLLKHGDVARAPAAMEALMKLGPAAAPEVVSLLGARHEKLRELALRFLSFYRDPQVLPALARFYNGGDNQAKIGALRVAALYKDQLARDILVNALQTGDEQLKLEAVDAMVNSGARELIPHLLKAAEEDSEIMVRVRAVEALFKLGERSAVPSFVRMLQYDRWEIRLAVLQALAWMGGTEHIPMVAQQLTHRRPDVIKAATKALKAMSYSDTDLSIEDWQALAESVGKRKPVPPTMLKQLTLTTGKETVVVAGDADADRKLLFLVPGDPERATWLVSFLAPLAKKNRVVVMGFNGCDPSRSGATQPLATCLGLVGARISAVRESLGLKRLFLGGHSTAAYAVLWYASELSPGVEGLMLVDATWPDPALLTRAQAATDGRLSDYWKGQLAQLEADRSLMTQQVYLMYRSRAELAALASSQRQALAVGEFFPPWGLLAQTDLATSYPELERRISAITLPTLLVFGDKDVGREESLARYRDLGKVKKNYVFASVADSVHFPHLGKADATRAAMLDFAALVQVRGDAVAQVSSGTVVYGQPVAVAAGTPQDEAPPIPVVAMVGSPLNQIWTGTPGAQRTEMAESLRQLSEAEDTGLEAGVQEAAEPVAEPEEEPAPMLVATSDKATPAAPPEEADEPEDSDATPVVVAPAAPTDAPAKVAAKQPTEVAAKQPAKVAAKQPAKVAKPAATPARLASKPARPANSSAGGNAVSQSFEKPGPNLWPWALVGAGVLAVAGGAYLNLAALSDARDADKLSPTLTDYNSRFDSLYNGATTKAYTAYGLYGAGALLVGGGITWLLLDGGSLPFFGLSLPTRQGDDTWGVSASCSF
jgi:pimeloyl-ACP methyl ester carboxylesterase/HEAT repeat protein